jgi:hypothetical protein
MSDKLEDVPENNTTEAKRLGQVTLKEIEEAFLTNKAKVARARANWLRDKYEIADKEINSKE